MSNEKKDVAFQVADAVRHEALPYGRGEVKDVREAPPDEYSRENQYQVYFPTVGKMAWFSESELKKAT